MTHRAKLLGALSSLVPYKPIVTVMSATWHGRRGRRHVCARTTLAPPGLAARTGGYGARRRARARSVHARCRPAWSEFPAMEFFASPPGKCAIFVADLLAPARSGI